jgi:hypothetical protein
MYALRHVRQLLANVPIRVVAMLHDTSVAMIEKTYSKYIADHADVLTGARCSTQRQQLGWPPRTSRATSIAEPRPTLR